MSTITAERNAEAVGEHPFVGRSTGLLIATDGTRQSDAAIGFVGLLPVDYTGEISVLTVVDRAPIPWGMVHASVVNDYERGLLDEARRRVGGQLDRLGATEWSLEVRSGDPATTIAALARNSATRLILVGLGSHGPAARFFGNETALRLMRMSATPVLAVDSSLRALPKRIVVAMDFREASIDAARLAIDLAAPGAIVTLVHVVPWERKEYVPERWFDEHQAHVAGQLERVVGWLGRSDKCRIDQKILYGAPGPALVACAEELDADLIAAGTHGRGFAGRMLGGHTLAKLVRGARRSVLVRPAAAVFPRLAEFGATVERGRDELGWTRRLNDFTRRNVGRRGCLEVDDPQLGAQVEMSGYRFLGATYDSPTKRVQLMFGSTQGTEPHLVRGISNIKAIGVLTEPADHRDRALSIVSDEGQTLLLLDGVTEPRIE